jgi:hypothetical protein
MYRVKLSRFLEGQASARSFLSYEDFESVPSVRREGPGRPNAAYDNSGERRPARPGGPDTTVAPKAVDEAPRNPFDQAPPGNPFDY